MSDITVTLMTAPDRGVALRLANLLVESRLCACVNVLDGVNSVYLWKGEVCQEEEVLLVAKSTHRRWVEIETLVSAEHPAEVPEIIHLPVKGGLPDYLAWVAESVRDDEV